LGMWVPIPRILSHIHDPSFSHLRPSVLFYLLFM
jgi:hypothetical protein